MYSMLMMGGPALFLLSLGFMLSEGFWKSLLEISTLQDWKQRCNHRMKSLSRLFQPLLAPTAYITLVLFRGEFFTCSRAGGSDTVCKRRVSDEDLLPQVSKKNELKLSKGDVHPLSVDLVSRYLSM